MYYGRANEEPHLLKKERAGAWKDERKRVDERSETDVLPNGRSGMQTASAEFEIHYSLGK